MARFRPLKPNKNSAKLVLEVLLEVLVLEVVGVVLEVLEVLGPKKHVKKPSRYASVEKG